MIRVLTGGAAAVALSLGIVAAVEAAVRPAPAPDVARDRYVEVKGGRMHVVVLEPPRGGSGRTLLLLHGASGNLKDLELSIGQRLARRHRVILVDRPGHGRSDRLAGRAMSSPARQADAIVEALDRLGAGPVVVVGHSWSGALATNLALDHPGRVSGLALLSPATHPYSSADAWYHRIAATPLLGPLFAATFVGPIGRGRFEDGVRETFKPGDPPPGYSERTEATLLLRPSEFVANAEDLVDLRGFLRRQAPRYGEIKVPTVIVTAETDGVVSPDIHSRPLHHQISGSRLVMARGAGHMPHWNATERVVDEIDAVAARAGR